MAGAEGAYKACVPRASQCCQCLCNAGQKSIMSKLISCTRKLNRSRLKKEEKSNELDPYMPERLFSNTCVVHDV